MNQVRRSIDQLKRVVATFDVRALVLIDIVVVGGRDELKPCVKQIAPGDADRARRRNRHFKSGIRKFWRKRGDLGEDQSELP